MHGHVLGAEEGAAELPDVGGAADEDVLGVEASPEERADRVEANVADLDVPSGAEVSDVPGAPVAHLPYVSFPGLVNNRPKPLEKLWASGMAGFRRS